MKDMMTKMVYIGGLLLLIFTNVTVGQSIKKGDKFEKMSFRNGNGDDLIEIDPTKNKLTIIDFWSHSCSACIKSFPKIEEYRKTYEGDVEIILVNPESADSTENLFKIRTWIDKPNVKMISGDTVLQKMFAVRGKPFIVWIDSTATVRAMTDGIPFNKNNIDRFLRNEDFAINEHTKVTYVTSFFDKQFEHDLLAYSYLAKHQIGVNNGAKKHRSFYERDITLSGGYSVVMLFQHAFEEGDKFDFGKPWSIVLKCEDPSIYKVPESREDYDSWREEYAYDYDMRVPLGKEKERYELMKDDLQRYFPIRARMDTIELSAYVLVKNQDRDMFKTKGGTPINTFFATPKMAKGEIISPEKRELVNQPYEKFSFRIKSLVEIKLNKPFVDLVQYNGNVDIVFDDLTLDFFTLRGLQEELDRYGLSIEERIMPISVLVLEEQQ